MIMYANAINIVKNPIAHGRGMHIETKWELRDQMGIESLENMN